MSLLQTIWEIKGALFTFLFTVLGAFLTFKEKSLDKKIGTKAGLFNTTGFIIIIAGAIVSIILAWFSNAEKKKDDAKITVTNQRLAAKSDSLEWLQKTILRRQIRDSRERSLTEKMRLYASFDQISQLTMEPVYDLYVKADTNRIRQDMGRSVQEIRLLFIQQKANGYLLKHKALQLRLEQTQNNFVDIYNKIFINPDKQYYPLLDLEKEYSAVVLDFRKTAEAETGRPLIIKDPE